MAGSDKRYIKNSKSVGTALAGLDGVVERGEELEPPLDLRVVFLYSADALKRFVFRKYAKLRNLGVV